MAEKRTFKELREILLNTLAKGKNTLNNLAKEAGVNWRTTDNHLNYLKGKGLVVEVFTSAYVRIFELTERGKEEASKTSSSEPSFVNKLKEAKKRSE